MITQGDKYLEAAFKRLEVISQDEEKRLEYTARQKALYDHNTLMEENYTKGRAEGFSEGKAEGRAEGIAEGRAEGRAGGIAEGEANGRAKERAELIAKLRANGMSEETINAYLK